MKPSFSLIMLVALSTGLVAFGEPAQVKSREEGLTLAQTKLAAIVAKENRLFAAASDERVMNEKELTRKIQDLVSDYESYLIDNPNDVTALILFGKFLRRVDQPGPATGMFLKADKINSNLSVVKQQIANYLAEKGRIADALPFLLRAVEAQSKDSDISSSTGHLLVPFSRGVGSIGHHYNVNQRP